MRASWVLSAALLAFTALGCGSGDGGSDKDGGADSSVDGCLSHSECKGNRICVGGTCVFPPNTGDPDGSAGALDNMDGGTGNGTQEGGMDGAGSETALCGNGVIDEGEHCDGVELGGETCESLGYGEGELNCHPVSCMFEISMCSEPTDAGDDGCESGQDLIIDRVAHIVYSPAAVRVTFRVLDCDEYPVRPLDQPEDVTVINDETGRDFNASEEGGGASAPDVPSEFGLYSVLALDMSDSIFNNDAVDDVVDGAKAFVQKMVSEPEGSLKQKVAVLVFGRTNATQVVLGFTDDVGALDNTLEELRASESLGTTNLYGAYMMAVNTVTGAGQDLELVERSVVIMTDGTHEAGDEDSMRAQALSLKETAEQNSSVTSFAIGIRGSYDENKLIELASKPDYFVMAEEADQLEGVFETVATRVEALAKSNYVVGVCTPIELGSPTLTIQIDVDGAQATRTVRYSTLGLTGDVASCDPDTIANPCRNRQCGASALPGFDCGSCSDPTPTCVSGQCVDPDADAGT